MNHTTKSTLTDALEPTNSSSSETSRAVSGNFARTSQSRSPATTTDESDAWAPCDLETSFASQAPRVPPPAKPQPPRPSAAAASAKERLQRKISQPPAADRTQAYDQRELRRLLEEADPALAAAFPGDRSATANVEPAPAPQARAAHSVHDLPTVRPAGVARKASPRDVATRDVSTVTQRESAAPDQDDLTTAYVRKVAGMDVEDAMRAARTPRVEASQRAATQPDNSQPDESLLDPDARDSCSFAELSDELALSAPLTATTTTHGSGVTATAESRTTTAEPHAAAAESHAATAESRAAATESRAATPASPARAAILTAPTARGVAIAATAASSQSERRESDEVSSERTSPHVRPRIVAKPKRSGWLGAAVFGATALVIALAGFTSIGKAKSAVAREWVVRHGVQLQRTYARAVGPATTEVPAAPAKVRLVDISISVDPPEAKLYLDGRVASNPLRVAYPADNVVHELRAEAEGRPPVTQSVRFDRDVTVVLALGFAAADGASSIH